MAKIKKRRARQRSADTERVIRPDAFHPQKAEQVEPGKREQDDPRGQESLAREDVPLQHLVDRAQILEAAGQDDESRARSSRAPASRRSAAAAAETPGTAPAGRMATRVPRRTSSCRAQVEFRRAGPIPRASVPTNGPTQAKDVSENVSPISSVPSDPPRCDAWSIFVSSEDGRVISNAPSRLRPKTTKTSGDKPVHPRIRSKLHDAERTEQRPSPAVPSPRTSR